VKQIVSKDEPCIYTCHRELCLSLFADGHASEIVLHLPIEVSRLSDADQARRSRTAIIGTDVIQLACKEGQWLFGGHYDMSKFNREKICSDP
jgi:hypothetical protein